MGRQTTWEVIQLLLRALKWEEIVGLFESKHSEVTGTSSGKWIRGSARVPVRPFVSGVESGAAVTEGRWHELSGEGERESDWETSCDAQWKFWSLIGHLICWSYRGDQASHYLRDYLVPPLSPFLSVSLSLSLTSCTCPSLSVLLFLLFAGRCLILTFSVLPFLLFTHICSTKSFWLPVFNYINSYVLYTNRYLTV